MPFPINQQAFAKRRCKIRYGPTGLHIFDRESGWNVLLDEICPRQSSWATVPRQVSIALTNACDLSCDYCFAPKTRSMLSFERILSWLCELDAHGTVGIGFGGGEPTLYPRFAELCIRAAKDTALAVTFTTHGHRLDNQLLGRLEGHIHFVRISMDGVGETYERLRRRSFGVLVERLSAVGRVARFGINYVVNSDTFPDLDRAIQLATETKASEFLLLPERPTKGRRGITEDTLRQLREWVIKYRGPVPLSISESSAAGLPISDPFAAEPALDKYAHIDAMGTLKLTSFENTGIPIIGTVMAALSQLRSLTNLNQ